MCVCGFFFVVLFFLFSFSRVVSAVSKTKAVGAELLRGLFLSLVLVLEYLVELCLEVKQLHRAAKALLRICLSPCKGTSGKM